MYPLAKQQRVGKRKREMGVVLSNPKATPDLLSLPDLALIWIFVHLDKRSRANLTMTCKRCELLSHSPELWRVARLNFLNQKVCIPYIGSIVSHSKYLHHLEVIGSMLSPGAECQYDENNNIVVLPSLFKQGVTLARLKSLYITELNVQRYFSEPRMMVSSLTALLSSQYELVVVQISSLRVQYEDGIAVLSSLALMNGGSLQRLDIANFFETRVFAFGDEFNAVLGRFKILKEFHVNYNCLDDGAISTLAKTVPKTLELLSVDVYGSEPHSHVISTSTWRRFKTYCTKARVHFDLDEIVHYHEVKSILTPGIPLHTLKFSTGYDLEEEVRLPAVFTLLAENFSHTIEEATFQMDNSYTAIDLEVLDFIQRCKKLNALDISAALGVGLIHVICKLKEYKKIGLSQFFVSITGATPDEALDLMHVEEEFLDMLYGDEDVDYVFSTDADDDVFSDSDLDIE